MKKILLIISAIIPMALTLMADEYHQSVGEFTKLSVQDSISVVYRCVPDSAGTVAFKADRKFADAIMFSVNNNELKVRVSTEAVGNPELPVIYVYSKFLEGVSNSASGTVKVIAPAPVPRFSANIVGNGAIEVTGLKASGVKAKINTGNGCISLQGECDWAKFNMVGTGTIQADNLKADTVDCKCLGSGTIGCWPEFKLNTNCLGSTKIYYKGDPAVRKKGGGKVIPIE